MRKKNLMRKNMTIEFDNINYDEKKRQKTSNFPGIALLYHESVNEFLQLCNYNINNQNKENL